MKKIVICAMLMALFVCTAAVAGSWNLNALKVEAAKAVPGSTEVGASQDDNGAFVGLQANGFNYQFTLSADQDSQMPDARTIDYKGHKAFFFEPMPGSGGLMILLNGDKSLTILCMAGFSSDTEIGLDDMTGIADKMNLGAL